MATAVVLTPLAIQRFSPGDYALWVLAVQVPSMIVAFDFGLGFSVVNRIGQAYRSPDGLAAVATELAGIRVLLRVAAGGWFVLGAALALAYSTSIAQSWPDVLHAAVALSLGLLCFAAGIPSSLWGRAQLAIEQGHRNALWEGVGKLATLVCSGAVLLWAPNLFLLIAAYMMPTTLFAWLNGRLFLRRHLDGLRGHPKVALKDAWRANRGSILYARFFVILQLGYVVGTAIDPYVLQFFSGATDVQYVSVLRRPFDALPMLTSLYSVALWPVFGRMYHARQWSRLWTGYGLTLSAAFLSTLAVGGALYWGRDPIYTYLGSGAVDIDAADVQWLVLQGVANSVFLISNMMLYAQDRVRRFALVNLVGTVLVLTSKVCAIQLGGVHAFVSVGACAYLVAVTIPTLVLAFHGLRADARRADELTHTRHFEP
ncbi:MAG: lipopolysaccharide biosynthesis protein [Dermatophilaceae bacterium]